MYRFLIFGFTLSLLVNCHNAIVSNDEPIEYKREIFKIVRLDNTERPYTWGGVSPYDNYPMDSSGVLLFLHDGYTYYHPVDIAQKILLFVNSYKITQDDEFLVRSKKFAQKLIDISYTVNDAIYFPYNFNWNLHGIPGETMSSPWFSGMAQGQVLSAIIRLFEVTKDSSYLPICDKIFLSFTRQISGKKPWMTFIDKNGYLWIEEYPWERGPTLALNGFIFAIYGLYDYYILTQNNRCKKILDGSLTTIKKYIKVYRNEGDLSYYCLRHRIKYKNYHTYHTEQLLMLYKFTEDAYFYNMYLNFYNDYH